GHPLGLEAFRLLPGVLGGLLAQRLFEPQEHGVVDGARRALLLVSHAVELVDDQLRRNAELLRQLVDPGLPGHISYPFRPISGATCPWLRSPRSRATTSGVAIAGARNAWGQRPRRTHSVRHSSRRHKYAPRP